MGVTGLWKLIEPCGKPVPVETLEGKILAVDISIWLHQVVKGFQDNKGSALANAHLLGLFHRLCKLLYYRVRPVFVFDGCVPQLKRDTIARRQMQRSKLNTEAERIHLLLLQSLAKEKVVQQALGANAAELLLKSPIKRIGKAARSDNAMDDIFKLPELPSSSATSNNSAYKTDAREEDSDCQDSSFTSDYANTTTSTDDSSFDESNPRHSYNTNLQSIDVRSQHFRNLPADVRHEILVDIKETRKQSSWGRLHELPSHRDEFSSFQMARLLKRRAVQESLEEAQQEMGGRSLTYSELTNFFTEEGIVEPSAVEKGSKQICSDENTRFLLVRDLKKKLSKVNEEAQEKDNSVPATVDKDTEMPQQLDDDVNPSSSKQPTVGIESNPNRKDSLGEEYDADLELALALSLEESNVYNDKDYDYESGDNLRLNREQRKHLKNAAVGPARAYMLEYGGMNEDEVVGIMEKTQGGSDVEGSFETKRRNVSAEYEQEFKLQVSDADTESDLESVKNMEIAANATFKVGEESEEIRLQVSDGSETDCELEEVVDNGTDSIESAVERLKSPLEIVVDLKETILPEEDLFADVFDVKLAEVLQTKDEETPSHSRLKELLQAGCTKSEAPNKQVETINILDELKQQVADVKKIKLADIELVCIEISDEETTETQWKPMQSPSLPAEVIQICDSDDDQKSPISKSPKMKTPSKNKIISEYFETNYVIKRTPDKPDSPADEQVPKVRSPFFVNKTPKSNQKRSGGKLMDSPTQSKKITKASKSLFKNSSTDEASTEGGGESLNSEAVINEAAQILKDQKTEDELQALASDVAKERRDLESERNRQDRMGMSISQRMNSDCQELLRLFGIPYIVAPMEAEAQCAFLDAVELTNGTITDDSDIWLFGGRTVYKNFFAQNKHVLEYRADQIEKSFNCNRQKLIQLACLVGSDYTTGVHGIGAVTALEILASFSSSKESLASDSILTIQATLSKFRDWWLASKTSAMVPGSSARLALQKKLKNIELHEGFPSTAVIEAYFTPKVDESRDAFRWGFPDVESIREFTRKTFGWTASKTDDILMPVIKKINEKKSQATIRNYFSVKSSLSVAQLKVSKRVQSAIDKMSGKVDDETTAKVVQTTRNKRSKRKQPATEETNNNIGITNVEPDSNLSLEPSTSKSAQKTANIPNTKEVIPQREMDLERMRKSKEKAAAVLKNSKKKRTS